MPPSPALAPPAPLSLPALRRQRRRSPLHSPSSALSSPAARRRKNHGNWSLDVLRPVIAETSRPSRRSSLYNNPEGTLLHYVPSSTPQADSVVIDRAMGALLGAAIGDAVGTTLEDLPSIPCAFIWRPPTTAPSGCRFVVHRRRHRHAGRCRVWPQRHASALAAAPRLAP